MADIRVRGNHELARKFRRMAFQSSKRITTPSLERGAEDFIKLILRPNWGFTDRTKKLRLSVDHEPLREGGKQVGLRVVAGRDAVNDRGQRYAGFVERRQRTRDSRPGPPYWFGRAWRIVQKRVARKVNREVTRRVAQQGSKR